MKVIKRIKTLSMVVCLGIALFSVGCNNGNETPPPCVTCGFNGNEQVQDVGEGGGLYAANGNGCVSIENPSGRPCGRFVLQPLTGNQR